MVDFIIKRIPFFTSKTSYSDDIQLKLFKR